MQARINALASLGSRPRSKTSFRIAYAPTEGFGRHAHSSCRLLLQHRKTAVWCSPPLSTLTLSHSSVRGSSFHRSSSTDTACRPGAAPAVSLDGDTFLSFRPFCPALAPFTEETPPLRMLDPRGDVDPLPAVAAVATLPDSSGTPPSSSANGSRPTHPKISSTPESRDTPLTPPAGPSPP